MTAGPTDSGWFYGKQGAPAGQHLGPYTWEQLLSFAREGVITPNDVVWSEQLGDWRSAGQVVGLFPAAPPPPPPPSAAAPPPPPTPGAYGAPGGYQAGYPAATPPAPRSRLLWILIPVIAVIVIGGGLGAYFGIWYNRIDDALDTALEDLFVQEEGEIFLEPAGTAGPEPFAGEDFVPAGPTSTLAIPTTSTLLPTTTAPPSTVTTAGATQPVTLASFSGDTPALYGGSKSKTQCDKEAQLRFLEQNPDKAAAFCAALNNDPTLRWSGGTQVRPDQLRDYFAELTPMMLTRDIRVTNHGYRNGRPTPRQSVLQAGQGVLVDQYGVPRVRCECGNPLTPPKPTKKTPTYTGTPWPGFDPTTIIVIQQTTIIIDTFVVVDVHTGDTFVRPAGTSGGQDGPPPSTDTTATTSPPTTAPPTTDTTSATDTGGPIAPGELNGTWEGTFTITALTFDQETAQAMEDEGCSLALLDALKDEPLPMSMDITVDQGGKSGTAMMLIDVSALDPEGSGAVESEPQMMTFTIDGTKIIFDVEDSDMPTSMIGNVARRGGRLVISGLMQMGDPTFSMKAVWEVVEG